MRQRKVKNLEDKLYSHRNYIIENPPELKGMWKDTFMKDRSGIFALEIGCGKGKFISDIANKNPENFYFAIEGNPSVALYTLQKIAEREIDNVRVFPGYLESVKDFFEEGELAGIYLNFSDPWPKARHAKRRLTYHRKLEEYAYAIRDNGFIEFKTDNDGLFKFSLLEAKSQDKLKIVECTTDLHSYRKLEDIVTTEYEEKFSKQGKNINFMRIERNPRK